MRVRIRSRAAILVLGLVACRPTAGPVEVTPGSADPSKPVEAPAPPWAPLASTIRWPSGALAIELPPGEPAPWLLPPFEPGIDHPLDELEPVALGERIGLARSGQLLVVTERDEGLLGMITLPPDVVWIGVDGSDRLIAADSHGRVFAADTITQALEQGLSPTGAVLDDAKAWDAAGKHVIATVGSAVMVSEDGGRSFRSTEPKRGVALRKAVVRADGVMVAQSKAKRATTYMSRNGGRHWRRSAWHPEKLWREGAWIMGWSYKEEGGFGPSEGEPGVLSADGRSWVDGFDEDRLTALIDYRDWSLDFRGGLVPTWGQWPSSTDPPAPPPPKRPLRGWPPGDVMDEELEALFDALMEDEAPEVEEAVCRGGGLACLRISLGDAPPPSRLDLRLFGDVRCQGKTELLECSSTHSRPPHLGVFDHAAGTLRLSLVPRGCMLVEVNQARGLGLLSCLRETWGSLLMVVEPDGTIHAEHEVDGDVQIDVKFVTMAEDGTLLVPGRLTCDPWARAWVRRPVAPGQREAWTALALPGVHVWRPVGRGYAVGVADHPDSQGRQADLWLAGPGLEPTRVLEGIPVLDDVTDVRVDDGRVSLFTDRWMVVRRDASLAPVELPSRERVVGGVTVTRVVPQRLCSGAATDLE